jgi:hypothetical protein
MHEDHEIIAPFVQSLVLFVVSILIALVSTKIQGAHAQGR